LNEWDLLENCTKIFLSSYDSPDLEKICEKLGVNPTEAKVGFGKVKGGGSTWIGSGSWGMVGAGIGLSVLSGIGAAAKNSAINGRIKELENYVFYNNIADYFNSEIMPKLLSSQPELLNQALVLKN